MYPNNLPQPQQPGQQPPQQYDYSVDYLNQISGNYTPKTAGPSKLVMLITAGLGLVSIIFFIAMLASGGPSAQDEATNVYARIKTLESISSDYQKKLRNNSLRSTNSGLTLQLNNAASDLGSPLAGIGVDTGKLPKDVETAESNYKATITKEFDDAIMNVQLDATYAREMAFQMATLRSMLLSTYKASSSDALKETLDSVYKQLEPFTTELAEFSAD